jgi:N-acetylglucosaminyl-diphospho-decaprenol L-rhamnosyltransferase
MCVYCINPTYRPDGDTSLRHESEALLMEGAASGIVVNYRTEELTAAAVHSLLDEPEIADVVVIDNGSSQQSSQTLKRNLPKDRVTVVSSEQNIGFARGVNLGVEHTSRPLIFLLNSDAVVEPGSLANLVRRMNDEPSTAVAAPIIQSPDGGNQVDSHGEFPSLRTMLLRTNRRDSDQSRPDWVSGAAMLIRRSAFEQVDGFDPAFHMYLEDVDLCRRLRASGWDIVRVRESRVVHAAGASSQSTEREKQYHESLKLFARKSGSSEMAIRILDVSHRAWSLLRLPRMKES